MALRGIASLTVGALAAAFLFEVTRGEPLDPLRLVWMTIVLATLAYLYGWITGQNDEGDDY
jgi:hypothetical protein